MKNRLLKPMLILMCGITLVGCGHHKEMGVTGNAKEYCDLEKITCTDSGAIYVDNTTGVLYMSWDRGITPIYNADGTLKTIDDYKNILH